jgi:hypothetical protein
MVDDVPLVTVLDAIHSRNLTPETAVALAGGATAPDSHEGEPLWVLLSRVWDRNVSTVHAARMLAGVHRWTGCRWARIQEELP